MKREGKLCMLICIMLATIIGSTSAFAAVTYYANLVSYDNTTSGVASTNVQGAIDNLYAAAVNYTSLDTRVQTLEGTYYTWKTEFNPSSSAGKGGTINFRYNNNVNPTSSIYEGASGEINISSPNDIQISSNNAFKNVDGTKSSFNISANSEATTSISTTQTGYTPMAVSLSPSNASAQIIYYYWGSNYSTLTVGVRNYSSSQISTTITYRIFYVRNEVQ